MERPNRRHRYVLAAALVVATLLLGPAPLLTAAAPPHALGSAEAAQAPATATLPLRTTGSSLTVPNPGAATTSSISGADAGSILRTVFPNYNGTLPGNFPGTVAGWQIGTPAYVPSTQELWLPNRAVSVNGIAPPPIAPAIIYNATTNRFVGFDLSVENTSAFLYNPNDGLLFSADAGNGSVGVINPTSGGWAHAAIGVGGDPSALAIDASTNFLYTANSNSDNITVVSCSSYTTGSISLPSGSKPHALAIDANDHILFVADGGDSFLRTVDTSTNTTGATFPLSGSPADVAYSQLARAIAISVPSSLDLVILNATALFPEYLPAVGQGISPVVAINSGATFVVGNASGSDVEAINATTGAISGYRAKAGTNVTELNTYTLSETVIAWAAGSRNLTAVDFATNSVLRTSESLAPEPWSVAFSPSVNRLYVVDDYAGTVMVLNASTGVSVFAPIRLPSDALSVSVDPVSELLYVGAWNGVFAINAVTGQSVANLTTLTGGNSPVLVDESNGLLWVNNLGTGLHALRLGTLAPVFSVPVRPPFGAQETMALDASLGELFVVNATSNFVEAINASTGALISSSIPAGGSPSSIAYDSADGALYVAGSNVTVIDPATGSQLGGAIPLPTHSGTPTIAYDPTRQYLYVATYNGSPTRATTITVLDGSSLSASHGSQATMPAGQLVTDIVPVSMAGSTLPAYSAVWLADAQSGTLSIIASPPHASSFTASPSQIDVGQTSQLLLGYAGGVGPDTIAYSGLPAGCAASNSAEVNCTPTSAGNYTITATISDAFGETAQISTALSVRGGLAVRAVFSPGIALDVGSVLNATAVVTGGSPSYSYAWNFGDGGRATGSSTSHAFTTPGTYLVSVAVTDSAQASASNSTLVTVNPLPTGTLSISPSNGTDVNLPLRFAATVTGGTGSGSANWSFGDGSFASGVSAAHAWTAPGNYTVQFHYVDALGKVWSESTSVRVAPSLNGTFTAGNPGATTAVGSSVSFSARPIGGLPSYNVTWAFGDGSYGFGLSANHAYALAGPYLVHAELTDSAGAHVFATLQLTIGASNATVPPASTSSPSGPDGQLFLGVLLGAAAAAVILAAVGRSQRRTRHPPSPYVPPEETLPPR